MGSRSSVSGKCLEYKNYCSKFNHIIIHICKNGDVSVCICVLCMAVNNIITEAIGLFFAQIRLIYQNETGIFLFGYFTPFQERVLYSEITTQFAERVVSFKSII